MIDDVLYNKFPYLHVASRENPHRKISHAMKNENPDEEDRDFLNNPHPEERRCLSLSWDQRGCPPLFDRISCWPMGTPNTSVVIPCFEEFNGIKYDTSKNATRFCQGNGTWAEKADYKNCVPLNVSNKEFLHPYQYPDYSHGIYFAGYSISLLTLIISFIAFISFREMYCLRNKIHINLFLTYILSNLFWILTSSFQTAMASEEGTAYVWCASMVLLRYFHLSTFFWMFVEGLYLFVQVIATFSIANSKLKLRHYLLIGWGTPLIIVIVWSLLLKNTSSTLMDSLLIGEENEGSRKNFLIPLKKKTIFEKKLFELEFARTNASLNCPFINKNSYEWIYTGPVILVLGLNTFFLIWIMSIVITKLRSPTPGMTEENNHQHWKATKALLVIIPLLGITYLITIYAPSDESFIAVILQHLRAFLLSTQGFAVTLPYCFLNTEVRSVLKTHWNRWKTARSIRNSHQTRNSVTLATFCSRDSRKNSILRSKSITQCSHVVNKDKKRLPISIPESVALITSDTNEVKDSIETFSPRNKDDKKMKLLSNHCCQQSLL